jgi:hypothetical protein
MPSSGAAPAYIEIIDFIAAGSTPQEVARFRPSPDAQKRVAELVDREKQSGLLTEEKSELIYYIQLEHILRMAKARARLILSSAQ